MLKRNSKFLLLLSILIRVGAVQAQPTVVNSATVNPEDSSVIISFTQPDLVSMEDCHYSVLASWRKHGLDNLPGKSISIASFDSELSFVQIIATPERRLRRQESGPLRRRWVNLYIRTELPCNESEWGSGEGIKIRIPTFKNGRLNTIRGFIREMKYHMAYYNP